MSRAFHALVMLAVLILPRSASARDVYLNGVRLDASTLVRNQKFDGCSVKFDESGNVWITAKGFEVAVGPEATDPEPVAPADGKLTKRYFVFAPQTSRGLVPFHLDVYLNDTLVRKLRADDDQLVLEITKQVRPGKNTVRIVATRKGKGTPGSPADVMTLVVGEGASAGARISIDKTLINYQRNGAELHNATNDFSFVGH